MTEGQWLKATKSLKMLEFLRAMGWASERKRQLFAVACCRRIWPLLRDGRSRRAVEIAERFADGRAGREEVEAAEADATAAGEATRTEQGWKPAERAVLACVTSCISGAGSDYWLAEVGTAYGAGKALGVQAREAARAQGKLKKRQLKVEQAAWAAESEILCALLRCIAGNPFRGAPVIESSWLAWNDGTVRRLAAAIYEERAFDRLPILADALEEAGCTDAEIVAHLRGPGPHARGCWVVDLLLGKK